MALMQYQYLISMLHGSQSVADNHGGFALSKFVISALMGQDYG